MCGIAGGIDLKEANLSAMLASLTHRGPDQQAEYRQKTVALGMRRLAILDLEHGEQPFQSACGQIVAVCNGEVYNWKSLRQELEFKGHRFKTQCDCEILPAAFLEWGTDLPKKLNGMFALAIHDARSNSLFLARDRCGQKPLYYTTKGAFRFASEIKALAVDHSLQPDPSHLSIWLSLRYLPEPVTMFRDIVTLPAAHWMLVSSSGKIELQRYWEPSDRFEERLERDGKLRKEDSLDALHRLTRSAVELSLQSDVPIAAYLSGGVDSALLAYYLKDLGADCETVSIGFGAASDETVAAQATADFHGLAHRPFQLTPHSLNELPRVIQQMDRPIGDTLILAFDHLAQQTSALGCKVALGGEGPDEHFAGYSFQKAFLTARKLGTPGRQAAACAINLLPERILNRIANFPANLGPEGRAKTSRYLRDFSSLSFFQQATRLHSLFEPHEIVALLNPDLTQQAHSLSESAAHDDPFFSLLALQYQHWLPDWSLIRQDKNTMAHSLEYRAPFLDHRLIDFAFSLPKEQKIRRGSDKVIWRQLAARHLPSAITHRPKQPFYLPLEHPEWRIPFLAYATETLSPERLQLHGWFNEAAIRPFLQSRHFLPLKQLAALVIFQLWFEQHAAHS